MFTANGDFRFTVAGFSSSKPLPRTYANGVTAHSLGSRRSRAPQVRSTMEEYAARWRGTPKGFQPEKTVVRRGWNPFRVRLSLLCYLGCATLWRPQALSCNAFGVSPTLRLGTTGIRQNSVFLAVRLNSCESNYAKVLSGRSPYGLSYSIGQPNGFVSVISSFLPLSNAVMASCRNRSSTRSAYILSSILPM